MHAPIPARDGTLTYRKGSGTTVWIGKKDIDSIRHYLKTHPKERAKTLAQLVHDAVHYFVEVREANQNLIEGLKRELATARPKKGEESPGLGEGGTR